MKRWILGLIVALAAAQASAQIPYKLQSAPLALNYDLDGEAADNDQVVVAATAADSTTFTIAAQPDTCRLVDVTVVDADSSITDGVMTIVGTDCWGYSLTATFTLTGGSGVKSGTVAASGAAYEIRASGAYFATITSVTTGVLTGEGGAGDTVAVGYTSNSGKIWPMYGRQDVYKNGRRFVNIFGAYDVNCLITNGAATTDVAGVSASTTACFENVAVGDLIRVNVGGQIQERVVATRTNADAITVDNALVLPSAGVNFSFKKRYVLADPIDAWIPVRGHDVVTFAVQVDVNANTGGVVSSIECGTETTEGLVTQIDFVFEVDTATVASGSAGTDTTAVDLRTNPHYTHCRASVKFATGDDADAAAENIDIVVGFRQ